MSGASVESRPPRLVMDRITKRFGGVVALQDVHFEVRPGEIHALCGENGAGKSTLMRILAGVLDDYEGELRLDGRAVRFRGPREAEAAGLRLVHQELALVPDLSVAANLGLGREPRTWLGLRDDRAMAAAARAVFERLGTPIDPHARVADLRIGDRQMVEIARALASEADVLILDEPTSALSEHESARLFRVLRDHRARGGSVVYISHKMDEVFALADRVTVLRDGRSVASCGADQASPAQVIRWMVGRDVAAAPRASLPAAAGPVLEVESLSLSAPRADRAARDILSGLSFSVRRGEVVGVAGLLGAGRTALLETLFGAGRGRVSGSIRLEGRPARFGHPAQAVAAGMALVPEDRKGLALFELLGVGPNITVAHLPALARGGVVGRRREDLAVLHAIDRHEIRTAGPRAPITSLSGGNQQKCVLARWLLSPPRVLLLDDPTRGIDVGAKAQIHALVHELARHEGLAVLMASSELPELLATCDRILVLCEGRLTADLPRAGATEERILRAATQFGGSAGE